MTKTELIFEIQRMNPGAGAGFLSRFDEDELEYYLDRLKFARSPRPSTKLWKKEIKKPRHMIAGGQIVEV